MKAQRQAASTHGHLILASTFPNLEPMPCPMPHAPCPPPTPHASDRLRLEGRFWIPSFFKVPRLCMSRRLARLPNRHYPESALGSKDNGHASNCGWKLPPTAHRRLPSVPWPVATMTNLANSGWSVMCSCRHSDAGRKGFGPRAESRTLRT